MTIAECNTRKLNCINLIDRIQHLDTFPNIKGLSETDKETLLLALHRSLAIENLNIEELIKNE